MSRVTTTRTVAPSDYRNEGEARFGHEMALGGPIRTYEQIAAEYSRRNPDDPITTADAKRIVNRVIGRLKKRARCAKPGDDLWGLVEVEEERNDD